MMAQGKKEYGIVGFGQMGGNLAQQALRKGMRVVAHVRSHAPLELLEAGIVEIESFADFKTNLTHPRAVFIHMPAGSQLDSVLDELALHLDPSDVLVDGGISYWGDSIRRHHRLKQERGIHLVDLGTSGGIEGALYGACFMVGGEPEAIALVEPILKELAIPGGYLHAGPPGAGHFTKLVHKGIEFGMLQAIGEGIDLLEHYRDRLDIASVVRCWCHGSEIRSFLLDLLLEGYDVQGGKSVIPTSIEDTSELSWLVNDAIEMEVSVPAISQAMMQLFALRDHNKYWVRAIAMILHELNDYP
jgi:6-phosphogluconate dehydrogenase